jgi:head-tail adaptor
MTCKRRKISAPKVKICLGSLDTEISLYQRSQQEPAQNSVDYTENLTLIDTEWALVKTNNRGEAIFDGTNMARNVTHDVYFQFRDDITAEIWVGIKDSSGNDIIYDVLDTENINEENEWIHLKAAKRGDKNILVNRI